jgi:hypothetical protein
VFWPLFNAEPIKLVAQAKNPDHTGEQSHRSRRGVGFSQSDPFYSVFCFRDPLLLDLVVKKGSDAKESS